MKRIITIYSALFFTICLFAQAPEKLSFQAIVRNSSGEPVRSSIVGMRIQILQGSEFGESVYIEKHIPITNVNGLVNIELGAGIVVSGNFASIDWGNGPYFLKTEIDPSGRTDYSITGISQLLSVPYALFAENSGTPGPQGDKGDTGPPGPAGDTKWGDVTGGINYSEGFVGIGTVAPVATLDVHGTLSIVDGTQSAGKVLTSDANGKASWEGGNTHIIGDLYQGGIIVSVWKVDGVEHGLIASLTDISSKSVWSNVATTLTGTNALSPVDGQGCTSAIISQPEHSTSAALLCDLYISGDFSDWYLPAAWELNQCYNAALVVNKILGATNGFQFDSYWSSTEFNDNSALYQNFLYGNTNFNIKGSKFRVRAIRAF